MEALDSTRRGTEASLSALASVGTPHGLSRRYYSVRARFGSAYERAARRRKGEELQEAFLTYRDMRLYFLTQLDLRPNFYFCRYLVMKVRRPLLTSLLTSAFSFFN